MPLLAPDHPSGRWTSHHDTGHWAQGSLLPGRLQAHWWFWALQHPWWWELCSQYVQPRPCSATGIQSVHCRDGLRKAQHCFKISLWPCGRGPSGPAWLLQEEQHAPPSAGYTACSTFNPITCSPPGSSPGCVTTEWATAVP